MNAMALLKSVFNAFRKSNKSSKGNNDDEKAGVGKIVAVDAILKAVAGHFLYHLPKEKIRGPQWLWGMVIGVAGTVGPLAFLIGGVKWDQKPLKDVLPNSRK